ncbi:MATE family efflux transporter [Metamycoplasma alkalescens]|uniref:Probable multidrug resistance protein NorM n=2 Tax=Metamycoplasma alkalescens TaxID=45363 RepID=A0A318UD58_9BACT|nr:MATE family efflux transporter [Metamycoplasma alkalescens]PYF43719.1 Na+-driven multidrug efflux pump [Metamycoplasma alkalescens]
MIKETSTHKHKNYFKRVIPQSRSDWKLYFLKTWPIIIGEILFSLNGFLDNFMVSHIPSGIDALTYANTYTGIIYTIFFAIQGIAAMFVGQYFGRKEYDKVKQIINLRILLFLFITIAFSIVCWSAPDAMIHLIGGKQIKGSVLNEARMYLMLICIGWIITSFSFNTNMLLNETGHSNYAFISASLTLIVNATINAILLYGFKGNAYYAAFGSIISGLVCLTSDLLFTYYKDRPIFINVLKIYYVTRPIAKQILKRIPAMLITIAAMITIPIRMIAWSRAFPDDLVNGSGISQKWMGLSAVTILGLVESLSSIASAITSACSTNVSYFVAGNLGKNNFEEAEKHAYALRGFHAIAGFGMSMIMLVVVLIIAYSKTTVSGAQANIPNNIEFYFKHENKEKFLNKIFRMQIESGIIDSRIVENAQKAIETFKDNPENFKNFLVSNEDTSKWIEAMQIQTGLTFRRIFLFTCLTFILFNPLWCWFYTAAALPRAGGRNIIGSITILAAFWASFIWLIILLFAFVPNFHLSLEITFLLFYSFDFVRFIIFEIVALKTNWKRNVTNEVINNLDNQETKKISV